MKKTLTRRKRNVVATTLGLLSLFSSTAVADGDTVRAYWQERQFEVGFHRVDIPIDCDEMKAKFKSLLSRAGARDAPYMHRPCAEYRATTVRVNVLTEATPGFNGDTLGARWTTIKLPRDIPALKRSDNADCILTELFASEALIHLNPREIANRFSCGTGPYVSRYSLSFDVLVPEP